MKTASLKKGTNILLWRLAARYPETSTIATVGLYPQNKHSVQAAYYFSVSAQVFAKHHATTLKQSQYSPVFSSATEGCWWSLVALMMTAAAQSYI